MALIIDQTVLMRWTAREQLKFYAGIRFNVDGWTLFAGVKLAGVKLLVPWSRIGVE